MNLQDWIVVLLVAGSFVYALWRLMPQAFRRKLAASLLRWPLPQGLRNHFQKAALNSGACACSACDAPAPKAAPSAQVMVFHPRKPH
jgi:hypothetical protein